MITRTLIPERILLPYAPDAEGLIFREFRGESDYQVMLDIINAAKGPDQLDRSDTLEDIASTFYHIYLTISLPGIQSPLLAVVAVVQGCGIQAN